MVGERLGENTHMGALSFQKGRISTPHLPCQPDVMAFP